MKPVAVVKVEHCPCGSRDMQIIEVFGATFAVECQECSRIGQFADDKVTAVRQWNKKIETQEGLKHELH